jgi:prepilin-type N-terminal cleavage/methylation domain-containing protein/prepilin-type processing-associated H-X9-DG protein
MIGSESKSRDMNRELSVIATGGAAEPKQTAERPLWDASGGFSLVELLVVVAIIAVLASLLFMALANAKAKAKQTGCLNNVKQLGLALQQFLTDYHVYPLVFVPKEIRAQYPEHDLGWNGALESTELSGASTVRLGGMQGAIARGIWICPAANHPQALSSNRWAVNSYGYNGFGVYKSSANLPNMPLHGLGGTTRGLSWALVAPPVADSAVVAPSDMMAIGDGFRGNDGIVTDETMLFGRDANAQEFYPESTRHAAERHQTKANVVFCDGHAESPTFQKLFQDADPASLSRWNRDHLPHEDELTK